MRSNNDIPNSYSENIFTYTYCFTFYTSIGFYKSLNLNSLYLHTYINKEMPIKNSHKSNLAYILDNGAYMAKIGSSQQNIPTVIPNCIMKVKSERRRPFIGDQIEECRDASGLFYILPFQKGYLVNWDIQKTVWDYMFSKELTSGKFSEIPLCMTEPVMNFQSVQDAMDEIFFEEYECCGVLRLTASDLIAYLYSVEHNRVETCLVIDSGYSFTHVVPYIQGRKYMSAIKRIDVGGKVLTNHLKEIISYRQLHVMDETFVINQMKEDCCFVSHNFLKDMKRTVHKDVRNTIMRDYILPDYNKIRRGYVDIPSSQTSETTTGSLMDLEENIEWNHIINSTQSKLLALNSYPTSSQSVFANSMSCHSTSPQSESSQSASFQLLQSETQSIRMNNERIIIPEILFHPSDIGIQQKGIAETVVESIKECPRSTQPELLDNIVLTGGNACFPNLNTRLFNDVRKHFEQEYDFTVFTPINPVTYAWEGGKSLASTENLYNFMVTKEEYEEYGSSLRSTQLKDFNFLG